MSSEYIGKRENEKETVMGKRQEVIGKWRLQSAKWKKTVQSWKLKSKGNKGTRKISTKHVLCHKLFFGGKRLAVGGKRAYSSVPTFYFPVYLGVWSAFTVWMRCYLSNPHSHFRIPHYSGVHSPCECVVENEIASQNYKQVEVLAMTRISGKWMGKGLTNVFVMVIREKRKRQKK